MLDGFGVAISKGKMPKDSDDDDPGANPRGTIGIEVDNSFETTRSVYPFVGLGTPNRTVPREIAPMVPWDAASIFLYLATYLDVDLARPPCQRNIAQ
jgi:hypothetical protein